MPKVRAVDAIKRVEITFVQNEAELFLYTEQKPGEVRITLGGIAFSGTVVETALVLALSRLVNERLGFKQRRLNKHVNGESDANRLPHDGAAGGSEALERGGLEEGTSSRPR